MGFGTRRGVARFCVLTSALAALGTASAFGGGWDIFHTIPRETLAMDYRTGDVMQAPPIPYGEYAKDYVGSVHEAVGMAAGMVHGLCSHCGGQACGMCGGTGLFHGHACGGCGGDGCPRCDGHGQLLTADPGAAYQGMGAPMAAPYANGGSGHGFLSMFHHGQGAAVVTPAGALCGPGQSCATPQGMPSGQVALPSAQVTCQTCGGMGHMGGRPCGLCGGRGLCAGVACGRCHGAGCNLCGGRGLVDPNSMCPNCHGAGCAACRGLGLNPHLLGTAHGLIASALHMNDIKYFVGPGGPVPLTPGYVPYVVTTRSPRDYFAFPPFSDQSQP